MAHFRVIIGITRIPCIYTLYLKTLKEVNGTAAALSGEVLDLLEAVVTVKPLRVLHAAVDVLSAAAAGVELSLIHI